MLFEAFAGKTEMQMGYLFKGWLDANAPKPLCPQSGEEDPNATALWSQPHREQAEREKRHILNGPKAFLHTIRKELGLAESYAVRTATLRIIGGSFTNGSEDVQWKGIKVAGFKNNDKDELVVEWESADRLDIVFAPLFHAAGKEWDASKFIEQWSAFDLSRRTAKA